MVDFTVDVSNIPNNGSPDPLMKEDLTTPFGQIETILENMANAVQAMNILADQGGSDPLAIASGVLTPTNMFHEITAQTGTTDNLDTITMGDLKFLFLVATAGDTITLRHGQDNINTFSESDIVLTGNKALFCMPYDFGSGSQVMVIGGGGSGSSSVNHGDPVAQTVVADERVYPNSGEYNLVLSAHTGTSINLIEVNMNNYTVGDVILLRAASGHTIDVQHNDGGATVKIHLYGDANIELDEKNPLVLRYVDSTTLAQDVDLTASGGSGAPSTATYITQTADAGLSNEQALSSLTTGVMKVTNGTGVISTAVANTDYAAATHASRHERGGADEIDGDHLDIDFTPSNYTPDTTPGEAANVDDLAAHLAGIDNALAGGGGGISQIQTQHIPPFTGVSRSNTSYGELSSNFRANVTTTGGDLFVTATPFAGCSSGAGKGYIQIQLWDGAVYITPDTDKDSGNAEIEFIGAAYTPRVVSAKFTGLAADDYEIHIMGKTDSGTTLFLNVNNSGQLIHYMEY